MPCLCVLLRVFFGFGFRLLGWFTFVCGCYILIVSFKFLLLFTDLVWWVDFGDSRVFLGVFSGFLSVGFRCFPVSAAVLRRIGVDII